MKQAVACLATILMLGVGEASAVTQCTQREAYAAEVVTDYLNSWGNVYLFFKQFGHCYDASIAEGAEDKIQLLWANHWSEVSQMIALTKKDPEFKAFLWTRISDETFPQDRFAVFVHNAKTKCPSLATDFCSAVVKAASRPIIPPATVR